MAKQRTPRRRTEKSAASGRTAGAAQARQLLVSALNEHRAGHLQAAEAVYRQAIQAWPENPEAWHRLGVLYAQAGQFGQAHDCLRKAVGFDPDTASYRNDLGNVYLAMSRPDDAIESYRAALAIDPGSAEARFNLGNALYACERLSEALEAFQAAAASAPGQPQIHANLGVVQQKLGRYDDAAASFRRALQIAPHFADAHYNLGLVMFAQGHVESAERSLVRALEIDPSRAEVHLALGNALYEMDKRDRALAAYRHAAELDPELAEARANMGSVLHDRGELKEAAAALRRALKIDPNYTSGHVNLGITLAAMDNPEGAVRSFKRALKAAPGDIRAQAHLATVLQEMGRKAEARALFDFRRLAKVFRTEAVEGWPSLAAFNRDLAEHVHAHPTLLADRPAKSTTGGSQTMEILFDDHPAIAALRGIIEANVAEYIETTLSKTRNPYAAAPPARWRLTGWAVVLNSGGYQSPHCHPAGFVSGVYYVRVPAVVKRGMAGDAGYLEFGQPHERRMGRHGTGAYISRAIEPEEGAMVLFPSYFWHNTIPFKSKQDRISIAFDVLPD